MAMPCALSHSPKQLDLIEAALAIARFMQRHRHSDVDALRQHEAALLQERSNARQGAALLPVLERMNQAAQAAAVNAERPDRPDEPLR